MQSNAKHRAVLLFCLLIISFAIPGSAQDAADHAALSGREQHLRNRLQILQRQQQLLLYERALIASDSKYVLLDVRSGRGALKYRSRILKAFDFALKPPAKSRRPGSGPLQLTGRIEGKPRERYLIFGDQVLVLRSAKSGLIAGMGRQITHVTVGTKDLASIFFALEKGSYIYIINDSQTK